MDNLYNRNMDDVFIYGNSKFFNVNDNLHRALSTLNFD